VVQAVIWVTIWLQVEETSEKHVSASELRSRFSRDYVKKFISFDTCQ
jgi:hypothetical protein